MRDATHQPAVAVPSTETSEQQRTNHEDRFLSTTSRRVSSPTPDTWPFPASLAHTPPTYDSMMLGGHTGRLRIPVIMLVAQTAAVVCAAFTIALAIISENAPSWIPLQARDSPKMSQYLARPSGTAKVTDVAGLIIGHSVCFLIWAVAVVTGLYCKEMALVDSQFDTSDLLFYSTSICPADFTNFSEAYRGLLIF